METVDPQSLTAYLTRLDAHQLRALLTRDPKTAAVWIRTTAIEGLPFAQLCYGRMLLEGSGVPRDQAAALTWFRRAAASGGANAAESDGAESDPDKLDAINMVGRCLDNGWGTQADAAAAAREYRRAADAGHAWAQYNLGHLYLEGRGVARDFNLAFSYYQRAADQGHERAMNLVGRCHEEGWGTQRDDAAASAAYRSSAERGYFRGQYNWASILLRRGQSDAAAIWFERAFQGGSDGVRRAVLDLLRASALETLRSLATRLLGNAAALPA